MTAEQDGHGRVARLGPLATGAFDHDKVARGVRLILEGIGEDLERDGLRDTPVRVARMYEEITSGLHEDPSRALGPGREVRPLAREQAVHGDDLVAARQQVLAQVTADETGPAGHHDPRHPQARPMPW